MVYTPGEFPRSLSQGRSDLPNGIYGSRDVLFFETDRQRNTGRVKELVVMNGQVSVSMLEGPYGRHRAYSDVRSLEGDYTYSVDRSSRNFNVNVHGVCKLVLHADARPMRLQSEDVRMMSIVDRRNRDDDRSCEKRGRRDTDYRDCKEHK